MTFWQAGAHPPAPRDHTDEWPHLGVCDPRPDRPSLLWALESFAADLALCRWPERALFDLAIWRERAADCPRFAALWETYAPPLVATLLTVRAEWETSLPDSRGARAVAEAEALRQFCACPSPAPPRPRRRPALRLLTNR